MVFSEYFKVMLITCTITNVFASKRIDTKSYNCKLNLNLKNKLTFAFKNHNIPYVELTEVQRRKLTCLVEEGIF